MNKKNKDAGSSERLSKHTIIQQYIKAVSVLLTAIAAILGFVFYGQKIILNTKISALKLKENTQEKYVEKIDTAIIQLRKANYLIRSNCNKYSGSTKALQKQGSLRFDVRSKLLMMATTIPFHFDKQVLIEVEALLSFDKSIPDLCMPTAPSDKKWEDYLTKINQAMYNNISHVHTRLTNIIK